MLWLPEEVPCGWSLEQEVRGFVSRRGWGNVKGFYPPLHSKCT